ncbi:hypothetical protein [Lysobacter enzymogenes]|uniref:hypothetical protein n=1 Tax=Lysobacter enzymogenes TaxID=69 RepID=UPI001A971333|nr:hypothetical protein [Lysobacter enzymogenes]QQP95652.1 hypothetical protein JHW38_20855 [Lysobacter enzymogenes]
MPERFVHTDAAAPPIASADAQRRESHARIDKVRKQRNRRHSGAARASGASSGAEARLRAMRAVETSALLG